MLTLRRARRPLAIVCMAVIALAVFAPGVAAIELAPPSLEFVLLPQPEPVSLVDALPVVAVEQRGALRAVLPRRAPPSPVAAGL
jgi:hypothetical protein